MSVLRLTLTARLTVLFTLVAASVLLGLCVLVARAVDMHFVELDRLYLEDKGHMVEKMVSGSATREALVNDLDGLLGSHEGLYVQVAINGRIAYGPPELVPNDVVPPQAHGEVVEWVYQGRTLRGLLERVRWSGDAGDSPQPDAGELSADLWIGVDTVHHAHFMGSMQRTLALYLLAATIVSGLLGWWAARQGLSPLKVMREKARAVTAHNLQARMPAESVPVEFAELAVALNGMFDRLQRDVQRLLDFSSDLAHELRTPLSNLLTQTQVALTQQRTPEAYRDVLASNAEEFERLAKMVADMLFLAKTENGIDLPHREHMALHREAQALLDFYEAVAEERHIRLTLTGEAELEGDRLMIRRAISNLLSNALRHALEGSEVGVQLTQTDAGVRLDVVNTGATIAADDIPRLFDRFYRADRSRAHPASEGAGLGLAITKAIVESHGGQITVQSADGRTCFTLNWPRHLGQARDRSGPTA